MSDLGKETISCWQESHAPRIVALASEDVTEGDEAASALCRRAFVIIRSPFTTLAFSFLFSFLFVFFFFLFSSLCMLMVAGFRYFNAEFSARLDSGLRFLSRLNSVSVDLEFEVPIAIVH